MNFQGFVGRYANTFELKIKTTNKQGPMVQVSKYTLEMLNAKGLQEVMRTRWAKGITLQLTLYNTSLNCMGPLT